MINTKKTIIKTKNRHMQFARMSTSYELGKSLKNYRFIRINNGFIQINNKSNFDEKFRKSCNKNSDEGYLLENDVDFP